MNSTNFDLTSVNDPLIESIRLRLPERVSAEVKRQLSAPAAPTMRLSDADLRQRNVLRSQAGLPLLPGVGIPTDTKVTAKQLEARTRIAALRPRKL